MKRMRDRVYRNETLIQENTYVIVISAQNKTTSTNSIMDEGYLFDLPISSTYRLSLCTTYF
jgi:hypothetical protein